MCDGVGGWTDFGGLGQIFRETYYYIGVNDNNKLTKIESIVMCFAH